MVHEGAAPAVASGTATALTALDVFRGFRLLAFRGGNGTLTRTLASRLKVHAGVASTASRSLATALSSTAAESYVRTRL